MFMHLAMSLIVDLQLNRSPFSRRHFVTATEEPDGFELRTEYHAEKLSDHTLEEKRTYLACIFLSSVYDKHCPPKEDAPVLILTQLIKHFGPIECHTIQ